MAEAKRQESEMETTESYRGPVREVNNAERMYAPANNNRPKTRRTRLRTAPKTSTPRIPLKTEAVKVPGSSIAFGKRISGGVLLLGETISATVWIYVIQIFFGVLSLIGYAVLGGLGTGVLFSATDVVLFGSVTNIGAGLFLLGGAGAALCGFITYLIVLSLSKTSRKFLASGNGKTDMFGPLIVAACVTALLCPIVNLLPIMWLWCLYKALS